MMNAIGRMLDLVYRPVLRTLEVLVCVMLAVLVLDVLLGVFTRFVIGEQTRWTEELAVYLLIWVSLLGTAVAYADGGHLGVDYLVGKFHPGVRRLTTRIVHGIVCLFALYAMVLGGGSLVEEALARQQVTPALNAPIGWLYSVVPLSGIFLAYFALHRIFVPEDEAPPATSETHGVGEV